MLARLFPQRFQKPGFIDDNRCLHLHSALLNTATTNSLSGGFVDFEPSEREVAWHCILQTEQV